jgi:hypothetical protein
MFCCYIYVCQIIYVIWHNIQMFLLGIGCFICSHQEQWIVELNANAKVPFNILTNVWYVVKLITNETIL